MRVINMNKTVEATTVETATSVESFLGALSESLEPMTHKSYHEMADVPVVEVDALAQLHANLAMLEDLQGRLSFVMKEVRYLMKV
ncbi:hypothetical protein [Bdellovibrio svalbardensis]|uniref:Uncharacterized protein n=1 Tax=Bdellovibrio svalbardensis TaxID=2972972 RepID=A0ABT6DPE6_9BACT|nr:hypothetical protein [Bdellovibrio svalbardensis]MDG0817789.1 hypothetical protein [Bdellovibrio svalbardensis]